MIIKARVLHALENAMQAMMLFIHVEEISSVIVEMDKDSNHVSAGKVQDKQGKEFFKTLMITRLIL